ncbi:hypothetical protein V0R50_06575 [Pseudomonas sp. 148P]|uniref:Uncharacterized protein n=1 Tax=Pseudomonas ulcerans TaxID=3115852 RepID=A0ABU7HMZ6_9PSED|nr:MULTISPECIES: hypothetical protein [unclassified Pseudomonas]MEE1921564.1 hypothetical protein [Pseudomonas sp. 147P]MEE1932878.1 hypothetical protein [Pseudomonas sp. 148P]
MQQAVAEPKILLRLRPQDTPSGISAATLDALVSQTGLNKTEVIHYALRRLANQCLPKYELDDGPLTDAQMAAIRAECPPTPEERITRRLF